MYSTHRFHNKTNDSYLSIGDPYDKTRNSDPRYKGRQFQTTPAKTGQLVGYFGEFKYAVDSYQDNNGYRVTQPRPNRKLGFGSLDAHRRDEFTLDIRAQQYRELLERERFFANQYVKSQGDSTIKDAGEAIASSTPQPNPALFQTQVPTLLYDIGKESAGGTTPICNKCSRETFYCKHRVGSGNDTLRRVGAARTSAAIVGSEINNVDKPAFGRKSHIKDFYDANHLSVAQH